MKQKVKGKKNREESGQEENRISSWHADLHPEIKKTVIAILFFVLAALFTLSFIGKGGTVGGWLFRVFDLLLGKGYFFAPLTFTLIGFSLLRSGAQRVMGATVLGGVLLLLVSLAGLEVAFGASSGGVAGSLFGGALFRLFDFWGSAIILCGLLVISLLLTFNMPFWKQFSEGREEEIGEEASKIKEEPSGEESAIGIKAVLENLQETIRSALASKEPGALPGAEPVSIGTSSGLKEEPLIALRKTAKRFDYQRPPLELFQGDRGSPSSGDIKANSNVIKRTLENFGIEVDMDQISVGPTVTQYTLKPAEGVKLAKIISLHNDLSLALAAHPIRIEAPIPGKSLVGVEVPNRSIALVGIRSLLEHKLFHEANQPLLTALGRDVSGMPVFADLARMPHLLVSGATGSGKSVCIHTMITSFLYRNPPEVLRFIIVDPKRVELSVYNDIPHLLTPVITEPKATVQALRWATKEMDRRYDLLSRHQTRDITGYNAFVSKTAERKHSESDEGEAQELLPYIVIIIDELADLMATFPREVESSIIRLAQMARAVGIHLVVATQRPSVEVITGLIKANITSRVAFQVASQIDSRTILDTAGAEKLLGNGDMLFLAGDTAKPRRIQGAYVSEQEVKRVVDFLREQSLVPEYEEAILETRVDEENGSAAGEFSDEKNDPLYEEARNLVLEAKRASSSYLQRRLRVGYARAARLLDLLEADGVIGPADGAKPREKPASGS